MPVLVAAPIVPRRESQRGMCRVKSACRRRMCVCGGGVKIGTWLLHSRFISEIKACDEVMYSRGQFFFCLFPPAASKDLQSGKKNFTGGNVRNSYFCTAAVVVGCVLLFPYGCPNPPPMHTHTHTRLLLRCCVRLRVSVAFHHLRYRCSHRDKPVSITPPRHLVDAASN